MRETQSNLSEESRMNIAETVCVNEMRQLV